MRDPHDTKLRELAFRLAQMAPDAKPLPEESMVQLRPSRTSQSTSPLTRRRSPWVLAGAAAAVVLILVGVPLLLGRLGTDEPPVATAPQGTTSIVPSTSTEAPTTTEPTPTTAVPAPLAPTNVTLYFLDGDGDLVSIGRVVDAGPDVHSRITAALAALYDGPTSDDDALLDGIATAIPSGTSLLGLTTDLTGAAGSAEVVVPDGFEIAAGPAVSQIVYTVTQFSEIDGVNLVPAAGGAAARFTRADLAEVLPPVFMDQPPVNGTVGSPFTLTGVVDVYELSGRPTTTSVDLSVRVGYELKDQEGNAIASGFTSAPCASAGCRGAFSFVATYELGQVDVGTVTVFAVSADDGSRIAEASHLVTIEAAGGESPGGGESPAGVIVDVDVAALPQFAANQTSVVDAGWGSGAGQLGRLEPQDFGPCCFDVAPDGRVVVSDSQNQRIVLHNDPDDLYILAEFDPADFVPDTVATDGTLVYVLGHTNRPGRPIDLVAIDLDLGIEVFRAETSLEGNADVRVTTDGVFAGLAGTPQWVKLADHGGVPITAAEQVAYPALLSETTIAVTFDGDMVLIDVTPAGDSPTTTYRIPTDGMSFDIVGVPRAPDANGVAVWMTPYLGEAAPSKLLVLGTDRGDLVGSRYEVPVTRTVEAGPFNTFRYGYGGLYLMQTNELGAEILRYELP